MGEQVEEGGEGGGRWRQKSWWEEGDEELDVQLDLSGVGRLHGGGRSLQGGLTSSAFHLKPSAGEIASVELWMPFSAPADERGPHTWGRTLSSKSPSMNVNHIPEPSKRHPSRAWVPEHPVALAG